MHEKYPASRVVITLRLSHIYVVFTKSAIKKTRHEVTLVDFLIVDRDEVQDNFERDEVNNWVIGLMKVNSLSLRISTGN